MTCRKIIFNARQKRAIRLLKSGPVMRRDLDRLAGCLNGPDLIYQLRQMGLEIFCKRVSLVDRDGKFRKMGRYEIAPGALDALQALGWVDGE